MRNLTIRPAAPGDTGLILEFIRELAEYEKLAHQVKATEDDVRALLFDPAPRAFCDIAEVDEEPVGFAFWFYNVSTFEGRRGLYLEDLFVRPAARGMGAGKALLAHLARRCLSEGLPRIQWAVLDWNAPSIAFYDSLGATARTEWITRQLTGEALHALASSFRRPTRSAG
jgi:GNAT superfamily N-acetyltransferase